MIRLRVGQTQVLTRYFKVKLTVVEYAFAPVCGPQRTNAVFDGTVVLCWMPPSVVAAVVIVGVVNCDANGDGRQPRTVHNFFCLKVDDGVH